MINNPILPGFNPDPSICRVGDDYYIATSTFEWYPGVQIHHSKDLKNWQLVARPLNRADLLDMTGVPDSCGVWAPCLSYSDDKFWLCFTNVQRFDGNFKDTPNFLTTCATIDGEWSSPTYMNSSGFDPSLFHDEDGLKWFLNMVWDHRPDRTFFGGIMMQEYCPKNDKLIGPRKNIFQGTPSDGTEAPHLYKKNGYYYLMTAEGGTGYAHAVTVARSKDIWGPYEVDPEGHPLTAADKPAKGLQRCGHASLVETQEGDFYLPHLCSRPLEGLKRSPLGRETAIQKFTYTEDGWFRMASGGNGPEDQVVMPDLPEFPVPAEMTYDDFSNSTLNPVYQWLRTPYPERFYSLTERAGYLRLKGNQSIGSTFMQALIARRQVDLAYSATTAVEFEPNDFQQMAGLICYYNSQQFHYLYISHDEEIGRYLSVMSCEGEASMALSFPTDFEKIQLPPSGSVTLKVDVNHAEMHFSWSLDQRTWSSLGVTLDASLLSDEAGRGDGANFTGTFVGLCCQDLTGDNTPADFSFFEYRGHDEDQ
ncbi:glycoside hydrolase family 43 protein [Temperatibacter marinus]|uniref:Glycoside hydrolase family 43 protein n=1 Tax=Temperatibacter marinus TaxID=1456591 RepID=A0AA52HAS1_9PROT|nr:glycoside hydrolase family 43 protein [Temperatibacter marinus]WND03892.1 glycoside hydrolase family 43 protein [Temperatibacter marinus]